MRATMIDPCIIFLDDLDEEDTLVDIHRWGSVSDASDASENDFETPVREPSTIRIPRSGTIIRS
jgi:hypothetical protein